MAIKIKVSDVNRELTIPAEKLATFKVEIQGQSFNFLVTRELRPGVAKDFTLPAVTHKESLCRVCGVTASELRAALNDFAGAGRLAVANLIKKVGEARVRAVLAGAI